MASAPTCDNTLETTRVSEVPISSGLTFHHIALICVAFFTFASVGMSFYLISRHATHYSRPWEQRYIMRILFMVPVYAVYCLVTTGFYRYYVYFTIALGVYEPIAIASYLTLICHYIAPTLEELEDFLRTKEARPWIFPVNLFYKCTGGQKGIFRTPRTSLTQFNIIWVSVFQYCVVRFLSVAIGLIMQGLGKYCQTSLSVRYAHLWLMILPTISAFLAMHALIQAHWTVRRKLKGNKIHFKLICIKLVVFLTLFQSIVISLATSSAKAKVNQYIGQTDLQVVFLCLILSFEMVIFSLMHLYAYPCEPYVLHGAEPGYQYLGGALGWRAYVDMFNFTDLGMSVGRGFYWLFVGIKHRNKQDYEPTQRQEEECTLN